jgi:hypothetical protein
VKLKQREFTRDPRGKEDISLVFSFTASQPRSEAEYLIYRKWATALAKLLCYISQSISGWHVNDKKHETSLYLA